MRNIPTHTIFFRNDKALGPFGWNYSFETSFMPNQFCQVMLRWSSFDQFLVQWDSKHQQILLFKSGNYCDLKYWCLNFTYYGIWSVKHNHVELLGRHCEFKPCHQHLTNSYCLMSNKWKYVWIANAFKRVQ